MAPISNHRLQAKYLEMMLRSYLLTVKDRVKINKMQLSFLLVGFEISTKLIVHVFRLSLEKPWFYLRLTIQLCVGYAYGHTTKIETRIYLRSWLDWYVARFVRNSLLASKQTVTASTLSYVSSAIHGQTSVTVTHSRQIQYIRMGKLRVGYYRDIQLFLWEWLASYLYKFILQAEIRQHIQSAMDRK